MVVRNEVEPPLREQVDAAAASIGIDLDVARITFKKALDYTARPGCVDFGPDGRSGITETFPVIFRDIIPRHHCTPLRPATSVAPKRGAFTRQSVPLKVSRVLQKAESTEVDELGHGTHGTAGKTLAIHAASVSAFACVSSASFRNDFDQQVSEHT
jgi:hypothetical protein